MTPEEMGAAIRAARDAERLTQAQLAELLGCDRARVIGWEKERHVPTNHYRSRLLELLPALPREVFSVTRPTSDEQVTARAVAIEDRYARLEARVSRLEALTLELLAELRGRPSDG